MEEIDEYKPKIEINTEKIAEINQRNSDAINKIDLFVDENQINKDLINNKDLNNNTDLNNNKKLIVNQLPNKKAEKKVVKWTNYKK